MSVNELHVNLFSKYSRAGPSSRLRTFQYLAALHADGIYVKTSHLFGDNYLRALYDGDRVRGVLAAGLCYPRRVLNIVRGRESEVDWIEGELLPYLPFAIESTLRYRRRPYVVDFDDALFHRYDLSPRALIRRVLGRKIDRIMAGAACVVTGNEYLAERARVAGATRVEIVPTVVDCCRYMPVEPDLRRELVVGWIGSPVTQCYLKDVAPALSKTCGQFGARLLLVGARPEVADWFGDVRVTIAPWSEEREAALVAGMDVGIMPLPDTPWERGKCGYKLLQYMACGVPVVASPVGVNRKIVGDTCGILAEHMDEWHDALARLLGDRGLRERMGRAGRGLVEHEYNVGVQAPRLAGILRYAAAFS